MTAKKIVPQSIELTYSQLSDAVTVLTPHVGTDDTLPMLTGIRFEAKGRVLTLAATDRYSMGLARIELDKPAAFNAVIPLKEIVRVLGIFKPARTHASLPCSLRVVIEDGKAMFEMLSAHNDLSGSRLAVKLIDSKFPSVDSILEPLLRSLAETTERVPYTAMQPGMLARFDAIRKVAQGTPVVLQQASPVKPLLITAYEHGTIDFIGIVMPVRLPAGDESLARLLDRYPAAKPVVVEPEPVVAPRKRAPRKAAAKPAVKATARKPRARKAA